ncbi:MAG: NAD(P)H-dependent oxidoreductase, partial [Oricola sp.]|nr:NAD(P)H-dependent oxidoreductase [Oricola sp.]
EHVETYLRAAFAFIGVTDPEFIIAEGLQLGPDQRKAAISAALESAASLKAA